MVAKITDREHKVFEVVIEKAKDYSYLNKEPVF
jgi:hypothetical protein